MSEERVQIPTANQVPCLFTAANSVSDTVVKEGNSNANGNIEVTMLAWRVLAPDLRQPGGPYLNRLMLRVSCYGL